MDESKFRPLRALVLVRRETPTAKKGGIIIPENVRTYGWRATVIRGGPLASDYKEGDEILFQKEFTVLPFKDRTLALTDAKHILAKLVVDGEIEAIMPCARFVIVKPDTVLWRADEIKLSVKTSKPVKSGLVLRWGPKCYYKNMECSQKVWYNDVTGVDCVENDVCYKILDEDGILAIEK